MMSTDSFEKDLFQNWIDPISGVIQKSRKVNGSKVTVDSQGNPVSMKLWFWILWVNLLFKKIQTRHLMSWCVQATEQRHHIITSEDPSQGIDALYDSTVLLGVSYWYSSCTTVLYCTGRLTVKWDATYSHFLSTRLDSRTHSRQYPHAKTETKNKLYSTVLYC
jgi:hypothetical protein